MKIACSECGKDFYMPMKTIVMLQESFRRNPRLKIVCSLKCFGWIPDPRGLEYWRKETK